MHQVSVQSCRAFASLLMCASPFIVYFGGDGDVSVFLLLLVEPKGWTNGKAVVLALCDVKAELFSGS